MNGKRCQVLRSGKKPDTWVGNVSGMAGGYWLPLGIPALGT